MAGKVSSWIPLGWAWLWLLGSAAGLQAEVISPPVSYIPGSFVGGYHVPSSSTVTFEQGMANQAGSPVFGMMFKELTISVENMMANPGAIGFSDPTASHPLNIVLHGNDGQRAEFRFLARPTLSSGPLMNQMSGIITLASNTLAGVDLSPFENGGTFDLYFSGHDLQFTPGNLTTPGGVTWVNGPIGDPNAETYPINSFNWFVLQANYAGDDGNPGGDNGGGPPGGGDGPGGPGGPPGGDNTGAEVPEPASLAIFGLLVPAGYWAYRRRQR